MTRRILIAEPSRTLTSLIRLTLAELDADPVCVADGHDAARALADGRFDLVIADVSLPGVDGYTVAGLARRPPHGRDVPVLLTASAHAALDAERVAYLGVDDVLVKPFERAALLERVRAMWQRPSPPPADAPQRASSPPADAPERATQPSPSATDDGRAAPHPHARREPGPDVVGDEARERRSGDGGYASLEEAIEARVQVAVAAHLEDLPRQVMTYLEARIVDHLERVAEPLIARAIEALVERDGATIVDRVARAAADALGDTIDARITEATVAATEPIVWKVAPEIAEDLIKREIQRLTEEGDA